MLDLLVKPTEQSAGAAFHTGDLLLVRGWSEFHGHSMRIDLAPDVGAVPCDEVLALGGRRGIGQWLLWRDHDGIVLQAQGRAREHFATISDCLDTIAPTGSEALTDIQPTVW